MRAVEAVKLSGSGPLQGPFIMSHCKGTRWDNWSPMPNVKHAFLMSTPCCSFNI